MQTSFPTDYSALTQLWSLWLEQDQWPALDKWLKNHGQLFSKPQRPTRFEARGSARISGTQDHLAAGFAMVSALRFVQLACALEYAYRAQKTDIDWLTWDQNWQVSDVKKIPPLAFWYWIGLRVSPETDPLLPPKALRDAPLRKEFFQQANAEIFPHGLWYGLRPQWLALLHEREKESDWSQARLKTWITQQTVTPPLWLRVQLEKNPADICAALNNEGVNAYFDSTGLRASGGKGIQSTAVYRQGCIEIQDLASQQIAAAVAVKPGQKVWDACAGAGGKSLAIAARMNNKGMLLATDLHAYKLEKLKQRAKRAQLFNIRSFTWDGSEALRLPREVAQQQGFDWVLIDAPCSSSGTWRRNPDARWRFTPADTAELVQLQQKILQHSAVSVRTGGHLVYATCSWQVCENEMQVAHFLQNHPEFSLISQAMLGAPDMDADSMFVAVLVRC